MNELLTTEDPILARAFLDYQITTIKCINLHLDIASAALAGRYRDIVLRIATIFASAEGVPSEKKLLCVTEIERALWDRRSSTPGELALEINSLLRECQNIVISRDHPVETLSVNSLAAQFVYRVACICTADGQVSEQSVALFHEVFRNMMDIDVAKSISASRRTIEITSRLTETLDEYPWWLEYLEKNDELKNTAYANRFRGLLIRVANAFAFADGVRSEKKLACVAQIERALLRPASIICVEKTSSPEQGAARERAACSAPRKTRQLGPCLK